MEMVGEHHVDVLGVLPAKHRVEAIDLAGEERHAFVLDGRAIQRDEPKPKEIRGLDELGQDHLSVVRGISRIVRVRAVFVVEEDEASVFDPVALRRSDREQDPLGQHGLGRELHFVVGLGKHEGFSGCALRRFLLMVRELFFVAADAGAQFFHGECVGQAVENVPVEVAHEAEFL